MLDFWNVKRQWQNHQKIKSLLYSLNTLSGVTSEWCPSPRLCARAHIQGCNGNKSLATCGRFDRLEIWTPYLPHQKQTYYLYVLSGRCWLYFNCIKYLVCWEILLDRVFSSSSKVYFCNYEQIVCKIYVNLRRIDTSYVRKYVKCS